VSCSLPAMLIVSPPPLFERNARADARGAAAPSLCAATGAALSPGPKITSAWYHVTQVADSPAGCLINPHGGRSASEIGPISRRYYRGPRSCGANASPSPSTAWDVHWYAIRSAFRKYERYYGRPTPVRVGANYYLDHDFFCRCIAQVQRALKRSRVVTMCVYAPSSTARRLVDEI